MNSELFKILAICVVAAAACIILKQKNAEYSFLVALAAGVVIFLFVLKNISVAIETIKYKISSLGLDNDYFSVALKAIGIGYITSFIADACRDSGQTSLAAKAELAGKTAIFLSSLPLMISVFETAIGFIK